MKQLVTTAAFLVAMSLAAPSAYALTAAQAKAVKKAVTSVAIPEMPAKAVELISKASKEDRQAVAITAVRAAIYKSRSSAPLIVAAVAKSAPDLAAVVSQAASEMEAQQAGVIARAAMIAAPESKTEIAASVNRGVALSEATSAEVTVASTSGAVQSPTTRGRFVPRASADSVQGGPITQTDQPISNTGGNGGTFVGASTATAPQPTTVPYGQPRTP